MQRTWHLNELLVLRWADFHEETRASAVRNEVLHQRQSQVYSLQVHKSTSSVLWIVQNQHGCTRRRHGLIHLLHLENKGICRRPAHALPPAKPARIQVPAGSFDAGQMCQLL